MNAWQPSRFRGAACALIALSTLAVPERAAAQPAAEQIAVDATRAAQKIFHVAVTMPAAPGPFTFVYPKWIPGYHGPVGPIEDVVNMHVSAGGAPIDWRRDLVDMYAVHATVPTAATSVHIEFDVVGASRATARSIRSARRNSRSSNTVTSRSIRKGATAEGTQVDATLTLPHGWTFGTALPVASQAGDTVTFAPASL